MSIKENFSTCYQLLEEMMDHGYPLTTEPNALKAMIQPPTVMGKLAEVVLRRAMGLARWPLVVCAPASLLVHAHSS